MVNGYHLLYQIFPIALIAYLTVILPVLSYFLYQKYQVRIRIKNVPYSTIFDLDLDKVKKNLKIESMVYNFIIGLIILEILAEVFLTVSPSILYRIRFPLLHPAPIFEMETHTSHSWKEYSIMMILSFSSEIPLSVIPSAICLFLIVLRRAFINLPYGNYVKGYGVYILVRVIVMLVLSGYFETQCILYMLFLPFFLFDMYVYISSSCAFYVLLKGRRDEAFYHSTRKDYLDKKVVANQFYHTQTFTHCVLFLMLLHYITNFYFGLTNLLRYTPFSIESLRDLFSQNNIFWHIGESIFPDLNIVTVLILNVYSFLTYLIILVCIVVKLYIQRKKINHVNDWLTRPLMENYRASLEERTQQRPPFIQAIRSHLIY